MVSTTTKLLLLSSTAGAAHALAPVVHHHGHANARLVRPAMGSASRQGRDPGSRSIQQGSHHRSNGRDVRLSYRRLHSTSPPSPPIVGGGIDRSSSTAPPSVVYNVTETPSLPIVYFDQLQKLDVLHSISQHVDETIGSEVIFTDEELTSPPVQLAFDSNDLDIQVQAKTSTSSEVDVSSSSRSSSKSETRQMTTSSEVDVSSSSRSSSKSETRQMTTSSEVDVSSSSRSSSKSETLQMMREIAAIALPSLGGMLLDPIMSLIDTACVGQVSTTALAAMAPCTSIFQFAFFAFFFLSAATTNLVASNPPESVYDPNDTREAAKRVDFNERVVSNAAGLAVVLGSLVTFALVQFSDPLLKLAGIPASNTALLNAARPYLLIRAMGLPFVFVATVLQGSSLGRGDAWRPLRIFGAAGLVNLFGDVWLTLFKGWGATGAATATVAAQVGAAIYYIVTSMRLDKSVEESSKPLRDVALVWRGLPSKKIVKTFLNVAMVLFSRSIGLMMAYTMMTRTAALGGEIALAAHQVTLQVWWLMSFLPEPMSVAAQTLITRDMKDRKHRVPKLIKTLYKMCGVLGLASALLTGAILRTPSIASTLVADVSVQKMMASLVPLAVLSQSYCPIGTLSDGVSIGLGSFSHLPIIMAGSFLTTAVSLAFVASQGMGVVGVWACMNIFLSSRIAGHLLMSKKLRKYLKKAFRRDKTLQQEPVMVPIAA